MRLLLLILGLGAATSAPATVVTVKEGGEVCRFRAAGGHDPFERWLTSQDLTCVASGSTMTFAPGLWNVFARSQSGISIDPILVDGARPPEALTIELAPAAALTANLPAGDTGVLYAPKRVAAFPAAGRTMVPASEELWLFVLAKSAPVSVVVIPPLDAGSERVVDLSPSKAMVGWLQIVDADRAALKTAHGVSLPRIRIKSADKEIEAASLPAPEVLDGAFVLFRGVAAGESELQLSGRGWLPLRTQIAIGPQSVTALRQPFVARASATLVVNWSTFDDLKALDRSLGSCEPSTAPPSFDLTISTCLPPHPGDAAPCQPIRKETLLPELTFGSVTIEEVPPGLYRAELRFGRLPPTVVTTQVAPLQQQPIRLQAFYLQAYGSLTRGGKPLGEDARIEFPHGGVGFVARDSDEYHAVLTEPVGSDARIDIVTCRGDHAFVLTDRPMPRKARFDLDIPDNLLTVTVVDTFTHAFLDTATLRYTVISRSMPRRPVLTSVLTHENGRRPEDAFVIKAVPPEREIRLQASNLGYKKQDIAPFSMSKSEKKEIEIQLVPLNGAEGKIVSSHPFEKGAIFWFSPAGVETDHADLDADGTFFFDERSHVRNETMTVVSQSHPLWVAHTPPMERGKSFEVRFPDAAPIRQAEILIPSSSARLATLIGVAIGGLRVPAAAFAQHMALRGSQPFVLGAGPLQIPALAETGPIDILRGPAVQLVQIAVDALALRDFTPSMIRRLTPGIEVIFEGK